MADSAPIPQRTTVGCIRNSLSRRYTAAAVAAFSQRVGRAQVHRLLKHYRGKYQSYIMIPLMENKMKWDRSKKKKFPDIEIEMSNTHYNGNDEKITKDETSIQMIPLWSTKQNIDTPNFGVKEQSLIMQSGDSGIESVQASPAQKANKPCSSSTIDMYDVPGPSTSRRFSSVYLHPDRARFNYPSPIASCSRDHNAIEVGDFGIVDGGGNLSAASSDASSLSVPGSGGPGGHRHSIPWGRRRSSTWTGRYSDAMDPEFTDLQRMTTRGSVGMHSLSDSLHKLTFTQSLAFPELARKLASRRRQEQLRAAINDNSQDDFEACSKFVAVAGGFLLSLMVYCVVNKYGKV
ncbi:uncharacterized protein LOC111035775 isoform X1 [Myzus persicae]|uniref:uncharacterized protein LOC111035775 isoform X1 n=2 Tax=Myzus persicae TaxID=13164 RepID=UPI000B92FC25|nr:uncharacterized protein LOC111035775 isoform X1 [Myzus persicae]